MSGGLVRVSRRVENMSNDMKKASKEATKFANNMKRNFEKIGDTAIKTTGAVASVVGGLAMKAGFTEAFNMEGYKVQLETAVKDTKKAGILMSNAVKFANKTPFETGEVVEATAKMEMYGLSSKRWLSDIADMAGSTNKSIDQATEAMADVAVGEFERIKEFGIKKDMILAESNKKYGEGVVFNAKGQVVDQAKLMDLVQEMMQKKYKGGAEKLSKTSKGLWSTITGVTKSALAKIIGMQEDGTIKTGSLLDTVKGKLGQLGEKIQKMQEDGTIDKIAQNATKAFNKAFKAIKKTFDFIVKHKKAIENVALAFASFYVALKVIKLVDMAMTGLTIATAILNGTLALSPFGWVAIGMTALIVGFTLLYKNSETFRKAVGDLWEGLKFIGSYIVNTLVPALVGILGSFFNFAISNIINIFSTLKKTGDAILRVLGGIIDFVVGVFTGDWQRAWEGITNIFGGIGDAIKAIFDGVANFITNKLKFLTDGIKGVLKALGLAKEDVGEFREQNKDNRPMAQKAKSKGFIMEKYALGGIATKPSIFGEAGAEIAIPLQKTPRSKSLLAQANSIIGGGGGNTNIVNSSSKSENFEIHIHGNVYGENDLIDKVGKAIVTKVIKEKLPVVTKA